MRNSTKIAAIALASAGLVAASAAPASAFASAAGGNCGYGRNQVCVAYAQSVPQVGTGSDVTVSCTALTTQSVQATIVQCYIVGNNGDVHWTPAILTQGQASTLVHTFDAWDLTSNTYRVCTGAGIFNGTYFGPSNFVCGSVV